ncbi:uncharacterized protein CLUP02_09948 [Colletotrichum lupini]|uniref:Uncharacterized protein n=1 Tax=Colletotrichum lupini TaxID=145971 RepID=A0A9Q8SVS6_9PEZI|nr:uncharacterized protein CLUP02_09948 [Colletotrichum lupini]UQC84451.1 hypothetical protein CLUP02_09948 [Colletotrichum lupini]
MSVEPPVLFHLCHHPKYHADLPEYLTYPTLYRHTQYMMAARQKGRIEFVTQPSSWFLSSSIDEAAHRVEDQLGSSRSSTTEISITIVFSFASLSYLAPYQLQSHESGMVARAELPRMCYSVPHMRCQTHPVYKSPASYKSHFLGGTLWLLISSISGTQNPWQFFKRQRVDSFPLSWYGKHASSDLRQNVTSLPDKAKYMRRRNRFDETRGEKKRRQTSDDAFFNSISDASHIASNNNGHSFLEGRDNFNMDQCRNSGPRVRTSTSNEQMRRSLSNWEATTRLKNRHNPRRSINDRPFSPPSKFHPNSIINFFFAKVAQICSTSSQPHHSLGIVST